VRRHAASAATLAAAVVGWLLVWAAAASSSATYDETTYLNAAARWWRTGDPIGITRMGTPNLFWKVQLAPTFLALDLAGRGTLIDDQPGRQAELLPIARLGASWIWLAGLALTALWARKLNGPWAMAFAAWLYALSPNLIAHGSLVTMEAPLTVATAAAFLAFGSFLATGRRLQFWASAALCGLAFACKFTAIVYPPILGVVWWLHDRPRRTLRKMIAMAGFVAAMLAADFALTGFAVLPLSPHVGDHPSATGRFAGLVSRAYETPIPQDWVGFATQMKHQATGGPSYLMGERRMHGWRYYYLVALAVKVPLAFWLLAGARLFRDGLRGCLTREPDRMLPQAMLLFFVVASLGSSRNYGVRYLLPMAPLAIVWLSRLAGDAGPEGRKIRVAVLSLGLLGQAVAVASVYPDELTYFNALAGGRGGGRYVLADSNLDWGQGLRPLRRLQEERPEYRDLTLYYFGDVDPAVYGVAGVGHVVDAVGAWPTPPPVESATTRYVGVSASLRHGPWGPDGFFRALDGLPPVATTDDGTIEVYRNPAPVRLMSDVP
jgi:hypothetical protein